MSRLFEEIQKRRWEIETTLEALERAATNEPKGRLRVSSQNGTGRYYHVQKSGDPSGKYIKRTQRDLAIALAQKEYRKKVTQSLRAELAALLRIELFYTQASESPPAGSFYTQATESPPAGSLYTQATDSPPARSFFHGPEEQIWRRLHGERRELIQPVVPDEARFVEEWMAQTYEQKGFREGAPEFFTASGIRVRSKTELIITQLLEKHKIPFHYEMPLRLKGYGEIHPDFTVLNVRRRETMYWEHMGMMDDADYRNKALERIDHYQMTGYYPGRELILTYETGIQPVRTRILEGIIEKYLK